MSLRETFRQQPFGGYCYAYPHKTAYRHFDPVPLRQVWRDENRDALFLYLHVPFCTGRCGYCNLMSIPGAGAGLVQSYLSAMKRQMEAVRQNLHPFSIARMAVGGGTPSVLSPEQLDELFVMSRGILNADPQITAPSVELSPDTTTPERIAVLRENGVHRVSVGVQSFLFDELRALGRNQSPRQMDTALGLLCDAAFPVFNIDLIYGIPGQTVGSFLDSLQRALAVSPSELYLYPLYIRKLTGMAASGAAVSPLMQAMYRQARELLLEKGFQQVSLRHFRHSVGKVQKRLPEYSCQTDGMIGFGCGARSYTRYLHYSGEYAVDRRRIESIIETYCRKSVRSFATVDYGVQMDEEERKRRFLLKSLLLCSGLDKDHYRREFGTEPETDFPQIRRLAQEGLARISPQRICLTGDGIELSDSIGPWLYSEKVRLLMENHQWQ